MRHRSGGASDAGVFSGCAFDLQESTPPPPSGGAIAAGGSMQSSTPVLPHFPLFSPLTGSSFPRGNGFASTVNTPKTPTTTTGGSSVATVVPSNQQGTAAAAVAARSKISADATKFPRMRLESGGSLLENYARGFTTPPSSSSLTNQPSTSSQQRTSGSVRSLGKCSPQPLTPSSVSSMPAAFKNFIPWWTPGSDVGERQQHNFHHPNNEYLNSLVTDELRTQLTVNTNPEDSHQRLFKDLAQSPLSCLLRQMQISSQLHSGAQSSGGTKRGSWLFDDDPLGGVTTMSPLTSPRGVSTLSAGPSTLSSSSIPAAATAASVSGCSVSAPVCIPSNGGGNRADREAFDYPCSCECCRRGGQVGGGTESRVGGHDSAFNSGSTSAAVCEFGAVGSVSLHSITSEGHDSALALSEAKEEPTTPDLPSLLQDKSGGFGSLLLANVYQSQGLLQGSNEASKTTTSAGGTTSGAISDIDKSGAFSLSTTQSPILHSSPFSSNPPSDLQRMAMLQELEETRSKLDASLQDLEALRCEYADQAQQTLALQIVVRQVVMILFNHLTEVRRMQEKAPQTPPSTSSPSSTSTTAASSIRDGASLNLLNDLLKVLLCDPIVRNALNNENANVPVNTTQMPTSTTGTRLKRPSSLRRKSSSNVTPLLTISLNY
ncbi:unnamed protein product [Rodentolepis nana]|uniref:Uncharacterized protein n=1 Tax=Rodentolepis nana TaxID=102285 RepID=A0A0R3TWS3_RODNA|nr:unnamed protein product [Rodentolepis nana]